MELVVPWKALLKVIEPHYPVAGRGRRPYPLQAMLRVHLMQNWFALSDPAMEEALYEIASPRGARSPDSVWRQSPTRRPS
jgi:IS5 family transposase